MKLNIMVYISTNYNYSAKYIKHLSLFQNQANLYVPDKEHIKLLKPYNFKLNLTPEGYLFSLIRDEMDYVFLFHDYKDIKSEQILEFCATKCIPLFIMSNPIDDVEF